MSRFFFGMITGAVLMYGSMHYHLVRGDDGFFLVPKISNNLQDVYVDIREFTLEDWKDHKPLAAAIMKSNRSEVLSDSALSGFRNDVHSLVDGLFAK